MDTDLRVCDGAELIYFPEVKEALNDSYLMGDDGWEGGMVDLLGI